MNPFLVAKLAVLVVKGVIHPWYISDLSPKDWLVVGIIIPKRLDFEPFVFHILKIKAHKLLRLIYAVGMSTV